jgi:hypothetical protein
MKTEQKRKKPSLIYQILTVNRSAGRLRFALLITIFFIFWSLMAQFNFLDPLSKDLLTVFPTSQNFTSDIFQNFFQMYFSPTTLILTFVPLLFFLFTRNLYANYLTSLLPSIQRNTFISYLYNCAFSFHHKKFNIKLDTLPNSNQFLNLFSIIGGPSKFSFPLNSIIITTHSNSNEYYAIRSNNPKETLDHTLSFREKLFSVHSISSYKIHAALKEFRDKSGNKLKIINTTISIDLLQPNTNTDAVIFTKISESDAIFLSDLGKKDKGFFESFIDDEINCFLKTEAFLTIFDNRLFSNRKKNLNTANSSLNKNTHSIHQNIIAMKKLSTNRISRKHKHMIYQYMNNNNYMNEDNKELKQMIEVVEKELMVYLTKQIQSFFNISKVCISTISIGDFLIDCSNQ